MGFVDSSRLTSQLERSRGSTCLHPSSIRIPHIHHHTQLFNTFWGLNSGPLACMVSALQAELSSYSLFSAPLSSLLSSFSLIHLPGPTTACVSSPDCCPSRHKRGDSLFESLLSEEGMKGKLSAGVEWLTAGRAQPPRLPETAARA